MSSYLEAYGAAEQHRARVFAIVKTASIVLVCALVLGLILYGVFRNHSEDQRARSFLALLQAHDYQSAYAMWGCTNTHPCPEYPFSKFQEDWGPKGEYANASTAHISWNSSQSCGTGVVVPLELNGAQEPVSLWVERDSGVISFAPELECPGRHWHFMAWLKSIFGHS